MLDLRTLKPLDENSIYDTASVPGRVIVHSANQMAGWELKLAALIAQKCIRRSRRAHHGSGCA